MKILQTIKSFQFCTSRRARAHMPLNDNRTIKLFTLPFVGENLHSHLNRLYDTPYVQPILNYTQNYRLADNSMRQTLTANIIKIHNVSLN